MFKCTICGENLEPHECIITHSEELCEIYVNCPRCGGECVDYKEVEREVERKDEREDENGEFI